MPQSWAGPHPTKARCALQRAGIKTALKAMIWVRSQGSHCEVSGRKSWKQWQPSCQSYSSVWLMRAFERQLARAGLAATSLSIRHPLFKALVPSFGFCWERIVSVIHKQQGTFTCYLKRGEHSVANHNWNSKINVLETTSHWLLANHHCNFYITGFLACA